MTTNNETNADWKKLHMLFVVAAQKGRLDVLQQIWNDYLNTETPIDVHYQRDLALYMTVNPGADIFLTTEVQTNQLHIIKQLLEWDATVRDEFLIQVSVITHHELTFFPRHLTRQQEILNLLLHSALHSPSQSLIHIQNILIVGSAAGCFSVVEHVLQQSNINDLSVSKVQEALYWAARNGHASVVQYLTEYLGQENGRRDMFLFTENDGIHVIFDNRINLHRDIRDTLITNGSVIRYLLQTGTDKDTIDGTIQKNPRANTKLLLYLISQLLNVHNVVFDPQNPVRLPINWNDPWNAGAYCFNGIADQIKCLSYIFTAETSLTPQILDQHFDKQRFGVQWLSFIQFDETRNNDEHRSDIIRLLYSTVIRPNDALRLKKGSMFAKIEIKPLFSWWFHSEFLRRYVLKDVHMMLSEFCTTNAISIASSMSIMDDDDDKHNNTFPPTNRFRNKNINATCQKQETVRQCVSTIGAWEMNEISKSKQAVMLRYFNRMTEPDKRYPEAFSVDDLLMLYGPAEQMVVEILKRNDFFVIKNNWWYNRYDENEDEDDETSSSGGSISSNIISGSRL